MKASAILTWFSITVLATYASAFCIYNNAKDGPDGEKTELWVRQAPLNAGRNYFSRFANPHLKQGEKSCCAYTNTDCVKSQNKDEIIQIYIRRQFGHGAEDDPWVITMPAGGWLNYAGGPAPRDTYIETFWADGRNYPLELVVDTQASYA